MKPRYAIYATRSHDTRGKAGYSDEFDSGEAQLERLRKAAAERGGRVVGEYIERDVSGLTGRGSERARLLRDAYSDELDVILAVSMDRFSRDVVEQITLPSQLEGIGVRLEFIEEEWDLSDPTKRLFAVVKAGMNEFTSLQAKKKIREKQEQRVSARGFHNGTPPAGYVKIDGLLVPDWGEPWTATSTRAALPGCDITVSPARAIGLIFERFAGCGSIAHVVDELRAGAFLRRSVVAQGKGQRAEQRLTPWTRHGVEYALINRAYCGQVQHRGTWHPAQHAPLVSVEVFEEAQRVLADARQSFSRGDRYGIESVNPLAGTIWCVETKYDGDTRPYEPMIARSTLKTRRDGTKHRVRAYARASTESKQRVRELVVIGEQPTWSGKGARQLEAEVMAWIEHVATKDDQWALVRQQCEQEAERATQALLHMIRENETRAAQVSTTLEDCDEAIRQLARGGRDAAIDRQRRKVVALEKEAAEIEQRLQMCEQLKGWYGSIPGEVEAARAQWLRAVDYYNKGRLRPLQTALRGILVQPYGVLVGNDGVREIHTRLSARLDELAERYGVMEGKCGRRDLNPHELALTRPST
jgi:DNA invertase Pin-like site-specific DNA recombinase